jgi:hypothetical protein
MRSWALCPAANAWAIQLARQQSRPPDLESAREALAAPGRRSDPAVARDSRRNKTPVRPPPLKNPRTISSPPCLRSRVRRQGVFRVRARRLADDGENGRHRRHVTAALPLLVLFLSSSLSSCPTRESPLARMAAGGGHGAAAGPLAGARTRPRVSAPPSSGLLVVPFDRVRG